MKPNIFCVKIIYHQDFTEAMSPAVDLPAPAPLVPSNSSFRIVRWTKRRHISDSDHGERTEEDAVEVLAEDASLFALEEGKLTDLDDTAASAADQCVANIRIFEYIRIFIDEYIHSPKYSQIF